MQCLNTQTKTSETLAFKNADYLYLKSQDETFDSLDGALKEESLFYSKLLFAASFNTICGFSDVAFVQSGKNPQDSMEAKEIFMTGAAFGRSYELRGNGVVVAMDANSAKPNAAKLLDRLQNVEILEDFELLRLCDARVLFCAGFVLEASRRFHVVLGGGLEMAFVLYIADLLRATLLMRPINTNISLITQESLKDREMMQKLLQKLSYTPHELSCEIDLSQSQIPLIQNISTQNDYELGASSAILALALASAIDEAAFREQLELLHYLR